MRSPQSSTIMILAVVLLVVSSAFAGGVHKGNLQVTETVQISGKPLPAGDYTVAWNGEGSNVSVTFVRQGKVVVTTAANVVALDKKPAGDEAEIKTSNTGARALTALRFSGQKYQLDLEGAAGGTASGASVK